MEFPRLFASHYARQNVRLTVILTSLLLLGTAAWAAFYAYDRGFTKRWRRAIHTELARHGLEATIGKLTLDPVEGLVARQVFLYDGPGQHRMLAKIDRISLDIDYGKFARGERFLSKIDFKKADLALPLDPARKKGERIYIKNFNAEILMRQDIIEVTHASGQFSEIDFSLRGSLKQGEGEGREVNSPAVSGEPKAALPDKRRADALIKRRYVAKKISDFLKRFEFKSGRPRLDIEMDGRLAEPENIRASVSLTGSNIECQDFRIESLQGSLETLKGEVILRKLRIKDETGEIQLAGSHRLGSQSAGYSLKSTARLPALIDALARRPFFSGVDFVAPPSISARGNLSWGSHAESEFATTLPEIENWLGKTGLSLQLRGRIDCPEMFAKGERFSGGCDFNISPDCVYLQNVRLEDDDFRSAEADLLLTAEDSRYDLELRTDPVAVARFLPKGELREFVNRFSFDRDSQIRVDLTGGRNPAGKLRWQHLGSIDLRDFIYNGQRFQRVEMDGDLYGPLLRLRDVRIEQNGGSAFDTAVTIDFEEERVTLEGLTSTELDPQRFLSVIDPSLAASTAVCDLELPPNLYIKGVVDYSDSAKNATDLTAVVTTRGNTTYEFLSEKEVFTNVSGSFQIREQSLNLNLTGKSTEAFDVNGLRARQPANISLTGRFPLDSSVPSEFFTVHAEAPEGVTYSFMNRELPLSLFRAVIKADAGTLAIDTEGKLHGGGFSASINLPDRSTSAYNAKVNGESIDFKQLAAQFAPGYETEGKLDLDVVLNAPDSEPNSVTGFGSFTVRDGNVFAIPVLGPLSPIISAFYRDKPVGYSVAKEASATFRVSDGELRTDDFQSRARGFVLQAGGSIDYVGNEIDLKASLRARGARKILFYPVSWLFKFQGGGSLDSPEWQWLNREQSAEKRGVPAE